MKEIRTPDGPYPVRLVYDVDEIDQICADALRKSRLLPADPEPIKIDLFLERFFEVVVDYQDLGEGNMGATVFNSQGAVSGFIISSLIEEEGTESASRRCRSTLAHEGGHGLLHSRLFMKDQTSSKMSGPTPKLTKEPPRILCRYSDVCAVGRNPVYDGRWWEWQANRAIGGLLLPKKLVAKAVENSINGKARCSTIPQSHRLPLERELAELFDVNPAVTRIRLAEMYP